MYEIDNWQEICIEVMKSVHGYEKEDYNRKLKCTDYTKNSEGVQLFRVPKRQGNTVKIDLNFVTKTQNQLDEGIYSEAILLANELTSASERLIRQNDKLSVISEDNAYFSNFDLLTAIYAEISKQCKRICGKVPESKEDCPAEVDKNHKCNVWIISSDADFHSKMGWTHLLYSDLNNLIRNREEQKKIVTKPN